jgi:hypothetical protein
VAHVCHGNGWTTRVTSVQSALFHLMVVCVVGFMWVVGAVVVVVGSWTCSV